MSQSIFERWIAMYKAKLKKQVRPIMSPGFCVNERGVQIACPPRKVLPSPSVCYDSYDARGRHLTKCTGEKAKVMAMEGMGSLGDCCGYGNMGCCDMISALQANGYDTSGMGAADAQLTQQVQSTLNMIPGASGTVAEPGKVGTLYDILTNTTYEELSSKLSDYKRKVDYLNESLRKIDARRDDLALRQQLLAEHAKVATTVGNYGKALINQINKYNELVSEISGSIAGQISTPNTVPVTGLVRLDVPTLSGMSGLGIEPMTVAMVGIIALILWKFGSLVEDYMIYDLKLKGISSGLDQEYQGFTGTIKKYVDQAGGSILTTALLIGGGVVAFLLVKNYMAKKGIISSPAKTEAKAAESKPAPALTTAKEAVKEVSAIAASA